MAGVSINGVNVHNVTSQVVSEGDAIVVVAGAWKDTVGVVQRIDFGKQTATINVELFGRETPVEIGFEEVRKMQVAIFIALLTSKFIGYFH